VIADVAGVAEGQALEPAGDVEAAWPVSGALPETGHHRPGDRPVAHGVRAESRRRVR